MTTQDEHVTRVQRKRHRQDILDAAEELFSKKGFRETSVRDITERANCNLASVNYHFQGKKNLYIEVFQHHMNAIRNHRIDAIQNLLLEKGNNATLEELIYSFSTAFLEPFLKKSSDQRLMELMMRERYDPHLPQRIFVEEIIQPVKTIMKAALLQVCHKLNDAEAELCIHSIVGQLVHIIQAQELFKGMDKTTVPVLDLSKAIEHVVKFSVGGIMKCVC